MNGTWLKMAVTFVAPVSGSANLSFNSKSGAQTFFVDDVAVVRGGVGNLIPNPSFESATTGWTLTNATAASGQNAEMARTGHQSLKVISSAGGLTAASTAGVIGGATAGRAHAGDIWVWSPVRRTFRIVMTEAGGASGGAASHTSYVVQARSWARLSHTHTVVQNDRARMELQVDASSFAPGDYFYADSASIVVGNNNVDAPYDFTNNDPIQAGWEEVYGPDFPLSETDPPAISNGLCRLTYVAGQTAFALECFVNGTYVELGRITLWYNETGTAQLLNVVQSASVVEWTPERGVIKLIMAGGSWRAQVFITLQRGWTAPRIEIYPVSPNFLAGGAIPGGEIRWSPIATTTTGTLYTGYNGTTYSMQLLQSDGTWNTAAMTSFAAGTWPFAALTGTIRTLAMSVTRTTDRVKTYNDTQAYGATRKAFAIATVNGASTGGYVGSRLHFAPAGAPTWFVIPALDGVLDFSEQVMLDVRTIPELVAR
jgi:hypothetical protein